MTMRIFPNSAGWNVSGPMRAHSRAPLVVESDPGDDGQQQEDQAEQPDRVRVGIELAIVADEQRA